ncbi:hypothetical protein IWW51_005486 [Coemansia sp. RSA 2702]|nr:hypothetical protein IWW51_005486 [Coemansia sp. RSA 2702]KAJ2358429.1 hypothetical protein H4S01_006304 [Coemansia sp. RSA 2610]
MPLMTFKTPERVCWNDDSSGLTFFVVAKPDCTAKWRATPTMPLDEVVNSPDVFSFNSDAGISRTATADELQAAFKTADLSAVVRSILSAGAVKCKTFELEVESQTTTAMNAASNVANVASSAATTALDGVKGYLSSFW